MQLKLIMELESDTIFGNGLSLPGGEDICIQTDVEGFPYYRGNTMKGIFREELINYLSWEGYSDQALEKEVLQLMGEGGSNELQDDRKLIFSDFTLHPYLIETIKNEKQISLSERKHMFSYIRDFTSLDEGMAKEGSLRKARVIKKGLHFWGYCNCSAQDEQLVKDIFSMIKWIGNSRNRGFGKVKIQVEVEHE